MQALSTVEPELTIYFLSEGAVTVEFGSKIGEATLQRVSDLNLQLHQNPFPGFTTAVPAYTTLSVFFDPMKVIRSSLAGSDCFEKVSLYLTDLTNQPRIVVKTIEQTITIPVCYELPFGPDLEHVAQLNDLTVREVIDLHSTATYKVYMMGFVPGFAYLGGMNEALATPRRSSPRSSVPAGAVGIAGSQTGIYPLTTPGGWQLIGQTPLKLFDAHRAEPSLLKAGDNVVFKAIDTHEFNRLAKY